MQHQPQLQRRTLYANKGQFGQGAPAYQKSLVKFCDTQLSKAIWHPNQRALFQEMRARAIALEGGEPPVTPGGQGPNTPTVAGPMSPEEKQLFEQWRAQQQQQAHQGPRPPANPGVVPQVQQQAVPPGWMGDAQARMDADRAYMEQTGALEPQARPQPTVAVNPGEGQSTAPEPGAPQPPAPEPAPAPAKPAREVKSGGPKPVK